MLWVISVQSGSVRCVSRLDLDVNMRFLVQSRIQYFITKNDARAVYLSKFTHLKYLKPAKNVSGSSLQSVYKHIFVI